MRLYGRLPLLMLVTSLVLCACATTQQSLKSEEKAKIKTIKILVTDAGPKIRILDHTGAWGQTSGAGVVGAQYGAAGGAAGGAIGGLLGGLVAAGRAYYLTEQSLGGDPDILAKSASNIPISEILFDELNEKLSTSFEVSRVVDTENKALPAETLLKVDLIHGLAVYSSDSASAAIDADVEIKDSSGSCLVRRRLQSDTLFKKSRALTEFARNNAEIYRADLNEAAASIAVQVASMFGMDVKFENPEVPAEGKRLSASAVTCSSPYRLTQDCSNFSGAKREVLIEGQKLKVAGTEDGKAILVMSNNYMRNELAVLFTLGKAQANSRESNDDLMAVEKLFSENGIRVLKITGMDSSSSTAGYLLELDQDGYSLLKKYTVHE